jgi:hypothetical protein
MRYGLADEVQEVKSERTSAQKEVAEHNATLLSNCHPNVFIYG